MSFSFTVRGTKRGVIKELTDETKSGSYASNEHARLCRDLAVSVLQETHDKVGHVLVEAAGHHSTADAYNNPGQGNINLKIEWDGWQQFHGDPTETVAEDADSDHDE